MLKIQKMLVGAMARLDEEMVINLVRQGLQMGIHPYVLLEEIRSGMERVGELYSKGDYFLADLIMSAEIFKDVLAMVAQLQAVQPTSRYGPIIFGTVQNDIHDIGKNITIGVLQYKGFEVIDLGIDVPGHVFVDALKEANSRILCLSGLITNSYDSMKQTIHLLEKSGLRERTTVIIGGLVNEAVRKYTNADYWSTDCEEVSQLCKDILRNNREAQVLTS
jgi:methanogenic corrinoid protein MtbC1